MNTPLWAGWGLPIIGRYNYDGQWGFIPWLRKDRARHLFSIGPIDIGINLIRPKRWRWWFDWRVGVLKYIKSRGFDIKLRYANDHGEWLQLVDWDGNIPEPPTGKESFIVCVFSPVDSGYVGDPDTVLMLIRRGIMPQISPKPNNDADTCTIGFCEREQKWYGWSHRAIAGFGIGHVCKEGTTPTTSGWVEDYIEEHPEQDLRVPVGFEVRTLDDAKRVAMAHAESVG